MLCIKLAGKAGLFTWLPQINYSAHLLECVFRKSERKEKKLYQWDWNPPLSIFFIQMGGDSLLTRDEIQDIINIANDIAEHTRLGILF